MVETVYLTQWIKDMLTSMVFGPREKMNLLLGDRVSNLEVYITNATIPFEGEVNSVSLERIPGFERIIGAVLNANRTYREMGLNWNRFVLFSCHSHPRMVGEIVQRGDEGWSVNDVPPEYESIRGSVTSAKDRDGNLLYFGLMSKSDKRKGGDDRFIKMVADKWRIMEHQLWVHPPFYLVGKQMTKDVAIDCFKYDPDMKLGKIRKIPIAPQVLTQEQLKKTILSPGDNLYYTDPRTDQLTLPYRKRR
tara:strand:- start:3046 stop:3789 length:744 start_codon:yes stop_codon:yes gene_type:complete